MQKNILFNIYNKEYKGILKYGDAESITVNFFIQELKDHFEMRSIANNIFNFYGKINNIEDFRALNCDIRSIKEGFVEIDIGTLYISLLKI